jgi:dolichol-phosphate mannosyltransferase
VNPIVELGVMIVGDLGAIARARSSPDFAMLELDGVLSIWLWLGLGFQLSTGAVLFWRLAQGKNRPRPLQPEWAPPEWAGKVTVLLPTLNEVKRLSPCLAGLTVQTEEVREILAIDSYSEDGTVASIEAAIAQDPRFHLILYDPDSDRWVGPSGALQTGFLRSSPESEWILRVDADTYPRPGLVASLLKAAIASNYDLLSVSAQFILKYPGEVWFHPAMLITFAYRFGAIGKRANSPDRVMANGQCLLCRRHVLEQLGGFAIARDAFCDDMKLARHAAKQGYRVGFLDGSKVVRVRMYEGVRETWREWGRTIGVRDASHPWQLWQDVVFLLAVQGLPPLILGFYAIAVPRSLLFQWPHVGLWSFNLLLMLARIAMLWAIAPYFDRTQAKAPWLFWLSPLADPVVWLRVLISALRPPKQWRGRRY